MRINSFSLALLATSVAAIPHRRHAHAHPVRRDADVVTEYVTETDMAVLYVDQDGNPLSTSVKPDDAPVPTDPAVAPAGYGPQSWGQPSAYGGPGTDYDQPESSESPSESSSEQPPPRSSTAPPSSAYPAPDTSSAPPPQSSSSGPSSSEPDDVVDVSGFSIAYAPYNADHSCKTKSEVDTDVDHLKEKNYGMVRIYGTDCEQVPNIMGAARRNDMKVFLGIWDVNATSAEAQLIVDGVQGDWDRVHTVSVGNEVLNRNQGTLSQVISGIQTTRSALRAAGFKGPVTTVEVYRKFMEDENKDLCDAVDYIAANCHPFFNSGKTAEGAGEYVVEQAQLLSVFCDNKLDVIITETGWPTGGQTNGLAVPGRQNQQTAIKALRDAYVDNPNQLVLFSAYDDPWKEDGPTTFGAEHFWGIYGTAPSARK